MSEIIDDAIMAMRKAQGLISNQRKDIYQLKASFEDMKNRNAVLRQRPDLPVDRIPAIAKMDKQREEIDQLKAQVISLEKNRSYYQDAERELSEAYLRIREILGAFDTPHAPTSQQMWKHTEDTANGLKAQVERLRDGLNQSIEAMVSELIERGHISENEIHDLRTLELETKAQSLAHVKTEAVEVFVNSLQGLLNEVERDGYAIDEFGFVSMAKNEAIIIRQQHSNNGDKS